QRDAHTALNRLADGPLLRRSARGIGLQQLETGGHAISHRDQLVVGADRARRWAGLVVRPVLPAETVQPALARFKKGDELADVVQAAQAYAGVVATARLRPRRVAFLEPVRQRHDLGPPFRPPDRSKAQIRGKPDLVKCHSLSSPVALAARQGALHLRRDLALAAGKAL